LLNVSLLDTHGPPPIEVSLEHIIWGTSIVLFLDVVPGVVAKITHGALISRYVALMWTLDIVVRLPACAIPDHISADLENDMYWCKKCHNSYYSRVRTGTFERKGGIQGLLQFCREGHTPADISRAVALQAIRQQKGRCIIDRVHISLDGLNDSRWSTLERFLVASAVVVSSTSISEAI
jgi:hypothetical protein